MPPYFQRFARPLLWLAFFLFVALVYLGEIGGAPLFGRDEPRYAQVAREMFGRGDWVTPTLGEQFWFEKPALLYWLIIAGYNLLGVSEAAARLGTALMGVSCIGIFAVLGRFIQQKTGENNRFLAPAMAGVMASSAGILVFSRAATFDIVLTATLTLALAFFLAAEIETDSKRQKLLYAGFWVGCGLALLAKGLIGLLLPALVLVGYTVWRRDWTIFRRCGIWWGIPLACLVAAIWYGPMFARHGGLFWHEFFVRHHFQRFTSDEFQHKQEFYFYLPILIFMTLPWTPFLVSALARISSKPTQSDQIEDKIWVFGFCWLVVPVAFFSASGSKLPSYILPALPGAVLLAALAVAQFVRGQSSGVALRFVVGICLVLAVAMVVYGVKKGTFPVANLMVMVTPLVAAAIFGAFSKRRFGGAAGVALGVMAVFALAPALGVNAALAQLSTRDLLVRAEREGYGNAPLYNWGDEERTSQFYAANRVKYDETGDVLEFSTIREFKKTLREHPKILVLAPNFRVAALRRNRAMKIDFVARNEKVVLLGIRSSE